MRIRNYQKTDVPFVLNSWWRSSQEARLNFTIIDIQGITEENPIKVCCDDLDESLIFGWVCYHEYKLYYIYVKQIVRRTGIGTLLLKEAFRYEEPIPICLTPKLERLLEDYDHKTLSARKASSARLYRASVPDSEEGRTTDGK